MKTLFLILLGIITIPLIYWSGNKEGYKEGYNDGYTDMCVIHNNSLLNTDSIYKAKKK
jgi:hypothetical protein